MHASITQKYVDIDFCKRLKGDKQTQLESLLSPIISKCITRGYHYEYVMNDIFWPFTRINYSYYCCSGIPNLRNIVSRFVILHILTYRSTNFQNLCIEIEHLYGTLLFRSQISVKMTFLVVFWNEHYLNYFLQRITVLGYLKILAICGM